MLIYEGLYQPWQTGMSRMGHPSRDWAGIPSHTCHGWDVPTVTRLVRPSRDNRASRLGHPSRDMGGMVQFTCPFYVTGGTSQPWQTGMSRMGRPSHDVGGTVQFTCPFYVVLMGTSKNWFLWIIRHSNYIKTHFKSCLKYFSLLPLPFSKKMG